jgi:hypothetical protein
MLVRLSHSPCRDVGALLKKRMKSKTITFKSISHNGTTYELSEPITPLFEKRSRTYVLQLNNLGIYAFGKTISEVKDAFCEEFDFIYNRYNNLSNNSLNNDVIKIKKRLNNLVLKPNPAKIN